MSERLRDIHDSPQIGLEEDVTFNHLCDFRDRKRTFEGGLHSGEQQVRADRGLKMDLDGVFRVSPERLYDQVSLDPLEGLYGPAVAVDVGDDKQPQLKVVGDERYHFIIHGIVEPYHTQILRVSLRDDVTGEANGLVADDARHPIDVVVCLDNLVPHRVLWPGDEVSLVLPVRKSVLPAHGATSGLIPFTFEYKYDVPFITLPVKISGNEYDLLLEVDTGSDRVIDLNTPFVKSHNLLDIQKPFAISHISSSDEGSGELRNVFFDEVTVGPYILPKVAGAFSTLTEGMQSKSDIDGTLGNNFLKRFNIIIDFNAQKLYLQPNNYFWTPFYDFLVE